MAGVSVWSALATASDSFDSVAKEGERRVKLGGRPTWHGSKANSDIEEMKTAMREQAEVQIAAAEAAYLEVSNVVYRDSSTVESNGGSVRGCSSRVE